ncbi:hypothetical protein [Luteococcus japonicus]|uniref:hypothetical protein n=1 Tax=Luteococcus japonicus TaxID=33984 RepID=UPI0011815C80|nr:hypothetical protein [Luteococcus japonicus]
MPEPIEQLEARVRADLRALDQRLAAERRAGRPVDSCVDWVEVRRLVGVPRAVATQEHPGLAANVRAAGVPNLSELVREALRGKEQVRAYAVKEFVQRRVSALQGSRGSVAITGTQVDSALGRLKRQGEVESLGYGLYRATDSLRGPSRP